jgi:pimeloyl-ACP methyl ester carboxylesterase
VRFGKILLVLLAALAVALGALLLRREAPPGPTGGWMPEQGLWPRFVTVEGVRVRYVRAGAGPPVVFLHGFASSIVTWRRVIPALAREHTVVAIDLPGFGASDQPPDLDASHYPKVIEAVIRQLDLARVSLVGNSLGGGAAVAFAAEHPQRVERLVLIDSAGFHLRPEERPWLVRLVGSQRWGSLLEKIPLRRFLVRTALREVFYDDSLVTPQEVEEYVAPFWRPGALASARSLAASPGWTDASAFDALVARVRAPTLVVWGREDRWIPVADADRFVAAIPGARQQILERCGHMPQEERPDEVVALLNAFLRER